MQKLPILFYLLLTSFIIACSSSDSSNETTSVSSTTPTEEVAAEIAPKEDRSSLDGFWSLFKEAVKEEDKTKLASMTKQGGEEENYLDYYDEHFFKLGKEEVALMNIDAIEEDEFQGEKILTFTIDVSDEHGDTGLVFHIGQKDGLYLINKIRVVGAGL